LHRLGVGEHHAGQITAQAGADDEYQAPDVFLPVVAEEIHLHRGGLGDGAQVAQVVGNAEGAVADEQHQRHHQADQGAGHIPGPGMDEPIHVVFSV
jgi:hypothetical protein